MPTAETFWNNIAERYAQKPVANPDAYQAKLKATKARLRPQDTVLDIGCGTGSLALELAPHVSEVHSVDISSEMIRIANQKAAAAGVDNVTFHAATVAELPPFGPERFDVVCAFNILHLVKDLPGALARLYALLKPGGHFISTTPCLGEGFVPYKPIITVMRWLGKAQAVEVFPVARLEAEMGKAGFVELERPTVSSDKTTAFVLARKPAAAGPP